MSSVTGQRAPKPAVEEFKSDNVKLLFQLNLEVKHVKEVQQNKKYVTRKNAQVRNLQYITKHRCQFIYISIIFYHYNKSKSFEQRIVWWEIGLSGVHAPKNVEEDFKLEQEKLSKRRKTMVQLVDHCLSLKKESVTFTIVQVIIHLYTHIIKNFYVETVYNTTNSDIFAFVYV